MGRRLTILVVEDDLNSRSLTEAVLQNSGYKVSCASDGIEALALARRHRPSLIISDILMPRMDGFALCRAVKFDAELATVPIIFYSATYVEPEDKKLALSLGAAQFIVKPVDVKLLISAVEEVLRQDFSPPQPASPAILADLNRQHGDRIGRKLDKKVTELEAERAALRLSEQRFRDFTEIAADWFWETDAELRLTLISDGLTKTTGLTRRQVLDKAWTTLFVETDNESDGLSYCVERLRTREPFAECELHWRHPDGGDRVMQLSGRPIFAEPGNRFIGYRGVGRDVTEDHRLSQQLSYQASHDALTDLYNRREFEHRLQRLIDTARDENLDHALCYLDLDQFKIINDTCGHAAGDHLLRQIATVLRGQIRKADILARLGGDEFGILLENCGLSQARRIAEGISAAVEDYQLHWEQKTFRVGVSVGLVPVTASSGSLSSVLSAADSACYAAKEKGGNRIHLSGHGDLNWAERQGEMHSLNRLIEALDNDQMELFFQPIAALGDARSGAIYELLLRMIDIDGEHILPGTFLPIAERYNLARRVDRWVLKNTFAWLRQRGDQLDQLALCFINLSGQSLADEQLSSYIFELFDRYQIPPQKIGFEITETAAIANLSEARRFMTELKSRGCRFALDDFGSGFCSYAYLKQLPVDFLKIDGLFVQDLMHNPISAAVAKSINDVGHAMGKQTIAEFVEDSATLDHLNQLGVDFAQGFGIAEPQPLSEARLGISH